MACIEGVNDMEDLKNKLSLVIEKVDFREVVLDIENFLEDKQILDFMKNNGKEWILEKIEEFN
ncbi:MAG: hypothetical protein LBF15_06655 [Candidatus Peribacteria bacterium]|nr:hypothetical protein [Candidatus Peribacteria bacterium]